MIIDCHHHYLPEKVLNDLPRYLKKGEKTEVAASHPTLPGVSTIAVVKDGLTLWNIPPNCYDLEAQINLMDKAAVDVGVLHLGLGQEWISTGLAAEV